MSTPATEARARRWYSWVWIIALPLAALYLLWRSLKQPEYRGFWSERFLARGAKPLPGAPVVWIHAVSVGETRAAQPLIEALLQRFPQASIVLTHMTPTGRTAGQALAQTRPGRVVQRYLPYDAVPLMRRFVRDVHPQLCVILETEVWPNMLFAARDADVPVALVNARLSEKSLGKAQRWPALIGAAARCFTLALAQTEADKQRLEQIHNGPIEVTGNLKFDLTPDAALQAQGSALRQQLAGSRPVWLFASTRDGDEVLLLNALMARKMESDPIFVLVPRHPQRFDEVARLIEAKGLRVLRKSVGQWQGPVEGRVVLLGDTMGEMPLYYALADAAFIGGSLTPLGGQNLIEACACGCPVVFGPHMFNFAQASRDALAAGAAIQVDDAVGVVQALAALSADQARWQRMRTDALAFAAAHRGATARTVERLAALIDC